jgi:hypothetical protein
MEGSHLPEYSPSPSHAPDSPSQRMYVRRPHASTP